MLMPTHQHRGFTLVELIMVIVIMAIIAAVVAPLIGGKYGAVIQSTERAKWVQQAEIGFFLMRRDLARAVPNSVFTSGTSGGNDQIAEFLFRDLGEPDFAYRYRHRQFNPWDRLQPNNDSSFDVFGSPGEYGPHTGLAQPPLYVSIGAESAADVRSSWENLFTSPDGDIAPVGDITNQAGENGNPIANVTIDHDDDGSADNHDFDGHSPHYRAYFTNGPVAYRCLDGQLQRIHGYNVLSNQPLATRLSSIRTGNNPVVSRALDNVLSCSFRVIPGQSYQPPSLEVMLEIGEGSESIRLIDTIQLENGA
ncbi:PulJ/GspJ family protein [Saccharospirillum salsuginis]|uniref:Prepilin-type N-terminal cleavage/methylation domain-containing protein n=1 Tax=Saccharospirillum salsuginis TaxID=418750 RepID=A0A918N876_9GAMM|nr:prepilin-type N-terminal cleavage/methylation domain-containing protein [Saccharospirillum salsuginis]GGX45605.1 hypothetical protein GCM10007392_10800 [Saccharospirillum salsuginis]